MTASLPKTMKAIVIKEPYNIKVEDVPTPEIKSPNDAIIKVVYAGLCGTSSSEQANLLRISSSPDPFADTTQAPTSTSTAATSPVPTAT
jgi:hypothetical protein